MESALGLHFGKHFQRPNLIKSCPTYFSQGNGQLTKDQNRKLRHIYIHTHTHI